MAIAPPITTLLMATHALAWPALALRYPVKERANSTETKVRGILIEADGNKIATSGTVAPLIKAAAEANAA